MSNLNSDPSFRGHRKTHVVALKLKDGIEAGGQKSRDEWADELHVPVGRISTSLTWLRKQGHLYYPISTKTGKNGKGGIVTDIMSKQEHIRETINRQDITFLAPHLEAISRIIEQSVTKFPHLAPLFQNFLLDKVTRLSAIKQSLPHGNRVSSHSKAKG